MAVRIGLDLGEKRVGVAVTDEGGLMAFPLKTLEIRGRNHLLEELKPLIEQYRVSEIVVGLPKTLRGEIGPAAQAVQETVAWMRERLQIPWIFWDERLTSQEVERVLREAEVTGSRRKEFRDQLAAQRILQSYLESRSRPAPGE